MLVPSAALAASSSCQAYHAKTCPPTSNTTVTTSPAPTGTPTSGATTGATTASGALPFTGLDLVALLGGATVLLGAGLVVRHLSRDQQD